MNEVTIQFQDVTGNWRTVSKTINNSQMVLASMKSAQYMYPNCRIRAVDGYGRIVDML
jgi:hypothetical protein